MQEPAFARTTRRSSTSTLKYSQETAAKHHLVVHAQIDPLGGKGKAIEFRYDHYPELERIQTESGANYVRKQGTAWIQSNDWGETGKKAKTSATKEFDSWISLVNAPIMNVQESRDKSQGGVVPTLVEGGEDEKSEEVVFEMRREKSTGIAYPRFGFVMFGGKALIHTFSGPMYYGTGRVMARMRYDFMFQVNMTMVTPTPSPATAAPLSPAASPAGEALLNAAAKKMQRGVWQVDGTFVMAKKTRIHGLLAGKDFHLTRESDDGKQFHQATIMTLSWSSTDGKTWKKADANDRSIYNWVHSSLLPNDQMPAFEIVGSESRDGETWQHLRLKVEEKIDDETRLPHYWIAVDAKGEPIAIRRFEGPGLIQGTVANTKIDYRPSKEPFIRPPMLK